MQWLVAISRQGTYSFGGTYFSGCQAARLPTLSHVYATSPNVSSAFVQRDSHTKDVARLAWFVSSGTAHVCELLGGEVLRPGLRRCL